MNSDLVAAAECSSDHCITCGDDGVPMTIVERQSDDGLVLCKDEAGEPSTVETTLVEPVAAGDRVLVHAGVALVKLEESA